MGTERRGEAAAQPLPGGGGGQRSTGDGFRPNLAMGGGSNRVPIELPHGPGGVTPKVELVYSTGLGSSHLGMGWALSVPFVQRSRPSPFSPLTAEEFTLSGAEPLVDLEDGRWAPAVGTSPQEFRRDGQAWTCRTPDLAEMRFGGTAASRLSGEVDGAPHTVRWMLDRVRYPNGVEVDYGYDTVDGEIRLSRVSYSAFTLDLEYEPRPDPTVSHALGFAVPLSTRLTRLVLRHTVGGGAPVEARAWELGYEQAPGNGASLLASLAVVGWQDGPGGAREETRQPPMRFGYTGFDPGGQRLRRLAGSTVPPPPPGGDTTLLDHRGTSLPGVLQLSREGARYWENRGGSFGPPQALRRLPGGISLAEDPVRFADLTGTGTADLLVGDTIGGQWWRHDPVEGFQAQPRLRLAPGFGADDERVSFLDLDGDGIVDVLAFRDGTPYGFMNVDRGRAWSGPHALPWGDLPAHLDRDPRLRFADMTGDGLPDVVLLRSGLVTYWPNLGGGRLGEARVVAETPRFEVPDPDEHVFLADVDGDGVADLVLVGAGEVRVHLGQGGRSFGPAIVIGRTPPISAARVSLADMTGSGLPGLLWTTPPATNGAGGYLHLDLVGGSKPYLLASIDNGRGLVTRIDYTTSARELARDLADGRRWQGYLPFPVHVVAAMRTEDTVTGQATRTDYRYHDGQYDGRTRQWLGFAEVESVDAGSDHEAETRQRLWFHNQTASAGVPAFEAGRGQPHRTELLDPDTGEARLVSTSTWSALPVVPDAPERGAWLAVESERGSVRQQDGTAYATERLVYEHDEIGNVVRESRRGEWADDEGDHVEELVVERRFAQHADRGPTSLVARERRSSGGLLLKAFDWHYDGTAFVGLPLGEVERGQVSRQTEVALTAEMEAAYDGDPALTGVLDAHYRIEVDPDLGPVRVHDTRRYRRDRWGNETETLDALGRRVVLAYDDDALTPTSVTEGDRPARALEFDPVGQQATLIEDANGHTVRTAYDGLGEIVAVWRRGADLARPTEVYERDRTAVPQRVTQRMRFRPDEADLGWTRVSHLDGAGSPFQVRTRTATGWAVERAEARSLRGREIAVLDAYAADSADFDPVVPAGVARHDKHHDFAGRLVRETLFDGAEVRHVHEGAQTHFFDPDATAALAADPATPPSRTSREDAWGRLVQIVEYDAGTPVVERRRYDALGQVVEVVDAAGRTALRSVLDGWGNRIRVDSLDAGRTRFCYDADNHEVLRVDADGRTVGHEHDAQGRVLRVLHDGVEQEVHAYDSGAGDNLVGRVATVTSPHTSVAYSYDPEGNPVRLTRRFTGDPTAYVVEFGYDHQGHVRSVRYPDGSEVTYDHDATGLLRGISGVVDDIEYGAHGQRTRIRFANGLETTRGYTPGSHLLTEIATTVVEAGPDRPAVGTAFQHLVLDLDAVGRVLGIEDRSSVAGKVRNTQTFGYDDRNRLAFATGTRAGGQAFRFDYAYDATGNLVDGETFTGMEHGHDGADPDHPNRLVRRGGAAAAEYAYDASGNLVADPELGGLEYDARHRLVRVTRPNGDVVEYDYDHHGRRIATRVTTAGVTETRLEVEGVYVVEGARTTRVVFDEDRRLALLPGSGDGLLHHLDRLGNVNVVSNLRTGAFTGGNEYTPWGQLVSSVTIEPAYAWGGALLTDGLDIVLLGSRWYRPALGRFLTADSYLLVHQRKLPGIHGGANLYLYALDNPANFSDPSGRLAFLAILVIAAIVGAVLGAVGAAMNGVDTWDEFLLWVVGGAVGGMLAVLAWGVIICGVAALFGGSVAFTAAMTAGLIIYAGAGLLGALLTPALDDSESGAAWGLSFLIKWIQSPIITTVGLVAAAVVAIGGGNVDFRRGMLFIEVGSGGGALTLGAVAWTQSGRFDADGKIPDNLARHEAVHSRTVAAIGELGFYLTYVTAGAIWAKAQGGAWNDLDGAGCGNPFEKTAHTYTNDPGTAVSASSC